MPFPAHWPAYLESYAIPAQEKLWRSLYLYDLYRLVLGGMLLVVLYPFGERYWLNTDGAALFLQTSLFYILLTLLALVPLRLRRPDFNLQLAGQITTDIVCLTLLSHLSGGVQSGLGVLLLISLAAAGLISRGKTTLFFAALASIAVLLEHAYAVLTENAASAQFLQAGLLSVAYFAVAWLAHTLAKYASASEQLALSRGADLASMAEANRLLIQDWQDGVLVVDEHALVRQLNPGAERLLGHTLAPSQSEIALADCSARLAELYADWRNEAQPDMAAVSLQDGGEPVNVRFLPVAHEGFRGAVIVLEDLQRIQAQAQQLKLAALGRLTASIAHEVRNPLSSISYAAELLRDEKRANSQARLIQLILSNTARINRIVQDVMQLNSRDRLHHETFDLAEKLPMFIDELSQSQHVAADLFTLDLPAPCPISFDRGHFEQVLWNLCVNALRYCRQQPGSVALRGESSEAGKFVLEIRDDGPGIAPDALPHLFEPFFTTNAAGTGLGLYISRELCAANGARLEYRPSDNGACFRIVLGESNEQ
ncbi:MAG: two-component sensor histidine kinase [Nitrosomonadales bacterium]|nr:two-component sensor histidine kinase [Nitrosomonadales bacterium]